MESVLFSMTPYGDPKNAQKVEARRAAMAHAASTVETWEPGPDRDEFMRLMELPDNAKKRSLMHAALRRRVTNWN